VIIRRQLSDFGHSRTSQTHISVSSKCLRQHGLPKFTLFKHCNNFNGTRSPPRGLNTFGFKPLRHILCFGVRSLDETICLSDHSYRDLFAFPMADGLRRPVALPLSGFSGCRWIEAWRTVFDPAKIVNRPSVALDEAE
jgi:hypothetical protein